jgi:hypothetical protein
MRVRGWSPSASSRAMRPSFVFGSIETASDRTASVSMRGRARRVGVGSAAARGLPEGFRGGRASGVGALSSRGFFGTYVGATLRVDRDGGLTGLTDPRVTRGMMRGGGHARVSVPMSAGWSDAEVRVLIPEPSRGLGDGVGGWTFRGRPGPRRGVVGDCTEASERVLLSLDGALIRCRLSCRDYLLPRFSRNNDKFTERLPLPLSAVAASTPGLGCDRSRSASLLLSRVDTTARDIAAFAPRSGQPHTSLCSD